MLIQQIPNSLTLLHKHKFFEQGKFSFKTTLLKGSLEHSPFIITENGLKFEVQLMNKLDTGIHLDTALFRHWLLNNSKDLRILNLFSYTCTLGVAAMKGNAFDVINVDSSKSALTLGKKNYELNDIPLNSRSFSKIRVNDFLKFAQKKKDLFDLVIIDPSPPPTSCKTVLEKFQYYQRLIEKSLFVLKPGSKLLLSSHQISCEEHKKILALILNQFLTLSLHQQIPYADNFSNSNAKISIFNYKPGTISESRNLM